MVVLLLMGIPGSGKSVIGREIQRAIVNSIIVSFDDISVAEGVWDESTFQTFRSKNLYTVSTMIESVTNKIKEQQTTPSAVIVDDLMYLRSMRREVYVMARDHNVPLLVVWVNTDVSVALERNSRREGRAHIDPSTILRIHEHLQQPDVSFIFDRVHMVIDNSVAADSRIPSISDVVTRVRRLWQEALQAQLVREGIAAAATAAGTAGDTGLKTSEDSMTKLLDAALRELISGAMKQAAHHLPASARTTLGVSFARAKAQILQSARGTEPREPEEVKNVLREHCLGFVRRVHDQSSQTGRDLEGADWSSFIDSLHSAVHAKFS